MFLADVIIIILPMPALWALQLPLKRRIVLMGLFSFGLHTLSQDWSIPTNME